MKTLAAVLWHTGDKWSVEELDLSDPGPREIQIKVRATGLCHSDDHIVTGDYPAPLPVVGGHEGAGDVVAIGAGVDRFQVGDRVVTFPMPSCGRCRFCSGGRAYLCSARTMATAAGDQFRFHMGDIGIGAFTQLGTFSEYTTISDVQAFLLPDDIPYEAAALVGCGVSTGYGAAVRAGQVAPGDVVVILGVGGVGNAAVQGARVAGASAIMAIDPVQFKLNEAKRFGATHVALSIAEAMPVLREVSCGRLADVVVVTVGVMHGDLLAEMAELVGKGGKLVMTSLTPLTESVVTLPLSGFALSGKSLVGNLAGLTNPVADFDEMWRLHRAGRVDLTGMITKTYTLDEVNDGYADMHAGNNVRGAIVFD